MGFELSEKRAEIASASSLGPTFGPRVWSLNRLSSERPRRLMGVFGF